MTCPPHSGAVQLSSGALPVCLGLLLPMVFSLPVSASLEWVESQALTGEQHFPFPTRDSPGKGQCEVLQRDGKIVEVINLMWLAHLRQDFPPAQPLEDHVHLDWSKNKTVVITLPQNWSWQELRFGIRTVAYIAGS